MGVSQQVVAAWERRSKALRSDTLVKLAEILRVSTDELLGLKTSGNSGPRGKVRRVFEDVSALPRSRQQRIVAVVEDMVTAARQASG